MIEYLLKHLHVVLDYFIAKGNPRRQNLVFSQIRELMKYIQSQRIKPMLKLIVMNWWMTLIQLFKVENYSLKKIPKILHEFFTPLISEYHAICSNKPPSPAMSSRSLASLASHKSSLKISGGIFTSTGLQIDSNKFTTKVDQSKQKLLHIANLEGRPNSQTMLKKRNAKQKSLAKLVDYGDNDEEEKKEDDP